MIIIHTWGVADGKVDADYVVGNILSVCATSVDDKLSQSFGFLFYTETPNLVPMGCHGSPFTILHI